MGIMTRKKIANRQDQAGIEPATGDRDGPLEAMSRKAYELIRVAERAK